MNEVWRSIEHPGYFGKRRDEKREEWDFRYGRENWRLRWETAGGETFLYEDIIWKVFVPGYVGHFREHPDEADWITGNFSYCFDKDPITRSEAFDIYSQYEKRGMANQFHDKACNLALEYYLGKPFRGKEPIQLRQGKVNGVKPLGWRWSPGLIMAVRPDLIPKTDISGWWKEGSIEDFYQKSKVLQVRA